MTPGGSSTEAARSMLSPLVWTAARKEPSRSRPTEARFEFLRRARAIVRMRYRSLWSWALALTAALEERARVQVDEGGAGQEADQSAEGEEGRERHPGLASVGV